jgi:hypothetical protein
MQIQSYKVTKREVRKVIAQQSRKLLIVLVQLWIVTTAGLGYLEVTMNCPLSALSVHSQCGKMAQFLC